MGTAKAGSGTFANVTVFDADFVDNSISKARDAIAGDVAILQLLDQGFQVGFDVAIALHYLEQAAIEHSEQVGFGIDRYRELGGVFVLRRVAIEYLRPAMAGDTLEIINWLETMRGPCADLVRSVGMKFVARKQLI